MFVYKLSYKNFYYIGSTDNFKRRLSSHKTRCFNKNSKKYNFEVYRKFRELGLTKENFYKEIKEEILVELENVNDDIKTIENVYIKLDDEFCLNDRKENQNAWNEDGSHNKEYWYIYYKKNKDKLKEKIKEYYEKNKGTFLCSVCNKYFSSNGNLIMHYKSKTHLKNCI